MMPRIALEITIGYVQHLCTYEKKRLLKLIIRLLGATDVSYIINVGEYGSRSIE